MKSCGLFQLSIFRGHGGNSIFPSGSSKKCCTCRNKGGSLAQGENWHNFNPRTNSQPEICLCPCLCPCEPPRPGKRKRKCTQCSLVHSYTRRQNIARYQSRRSDQRGIDLDSRKIKGCLSRDESSACNNLVIRSRTSEGRKHLTWTKTAEIKPIMNYGKMSIIHSYGNNSVATKGQESSFVN